jgi:predicted PurR-regulated permease PerM
VIIAILVGATLLGVLGALLAIPVAAAIQIIVRDVQRARKAAATAIDHPDPDDRPAGRPEAQT